MKIADLLEAPFTDKQEREFFKRVRNLDDVSYLDVHAIHPRAVADGGAYASVFTHPNSKYAVKIATADPRTVKYLKWCAANQSNPYVPKIYSIKESKSKNTAYIRMEKLDNFSKKFQWSEKHLPMLWFWHHNIHRLHAVTWAQALGLKIPENKRYSNSEEMASLPGSLFPDKDEFKKFKAEMQAASVKDPIAKVINAAKKFAYDDTHLDLTLSVDGASNVMVRPGTNQLVITDPVAS